MTSNTYIKEQSLRDWKTIGVVYHRTVPKFGCGHKGTLGTPDQSRCASCQMERVKKERIEP